MIYEKLSCVLLWTYACVFGENLQYKTTDVNDKLSEQFMQNQLGLLDSAIRSSDYPASNDTMINEWWTGKVVVGSHHCLI